MNIFEILATLGDIIAILSASYLLLRFLWKLFVKKLYDDLKAQDNKDA